MGSLLALLVNEIKQVNLSVEPGIDSALRVSYG